MSIHPIHYVYLLGDRPTPGLGGFAILPPEELVNSNLLNLGFLPQTMEHFVFGYNFYRSLLFTGEFCGYSTIFVYNDSLKQFIDKAEIVKKDNPIVYRIIPKEYQQLDMISTMLRKHHSENALYLVNDKQTSWFNFGGAVSTVEELLLRFYQMVPHYMDLTKVETPYSVPDAGSLLDRGLAFNPTRVNSLIGQSMIGNWGFEVSNIAYEDKTEESSRAMDNEDSFDRQNQIIEQIRVLNSIENATLQFIGVKKQIDHRKAPLILIMPYTASDHRKQVKNYQIDGFEPQKEAVNYVLSQTTSKNYTVSNEIQQNSHLSWESIAAANYFIFGRRMSLLDGIGLLHASLRHSPCLRLPALGIEINRVLSFVSPRESGHVINANLNDVNSKSIEKVISKIGKEITERALSANAKQMLAQSRRQIVTISDLPAEWLVIDGYPLGFTHDICRIPEIPNAGIMMHYVITQAKRYNVPRDIMRKTLVVYGCSDDSFLIGQEKCEELKTRLGFSTVRCTNKNEFIKAFNKFHPEFLILDTHGGYDEYSHQTYVLIGNDLVYPQEFVDNHINAPLVFISACNTAPTYNAVNTVANGLFEAGSLCVTSAYLPLEVYNSSTLYLRLLNSLAYAANHPMHPNWLSLISHILRTSYIHNAFEEYYTKSSKTTRKIASYEPTMYTTTSMIFEKRRELYDKLRNGIEIDGHKVNFTNKIPHYLMYTTLGRADLVRFQSYVEGVIEKEVEEVIEHIEN